MNFKDLLVSQNFAPENIRSKNYLDSIKTTTTDVDHAKMNSLRRSF